MSPFCGQLSDKSQLAFAFHMGVLSVKRNRDEKSNAERFPTVRRTASPTAAGAVSQCRDVLCAPESDRIVLFAAKCREGSTADNDL